MQTVLAVVASASFGAKTRVMTQRVDTATSKLTRVWRTLVHFWQQNNNYYKLQQ